MPRIYVKFSGLQQLETTCSDASATLSEIQSDFQKTVRQLDWDVRLQSDINRTASRLSGKLSSYTAALKKYQSFLNDAHSAYQELDVYQGLAFATPDPDQTTSYGFDWKDTLIRYGITAHACIRKESWTRINCSCLIMNRSNVCTLWDFRMERGWLF